MATKWRFISTWKSRITPRWAEFWPWTHRMAECGFFRASKLKAPAPFGAGTFYSAAYYAIPHKSVRKSVRRAAKTVPLFAKEKSPEAAWLQGFLDGGDGRTWTGYLDNANVALSQVSYAPKQIYIISQSKIFDKGFWKKFLVSGEKAFVVKKYAAKCAVCVVKPPF